MRPKSALASLEPASSAGLHFYDVADVENSLEDAVEVHVDDDAVGSKVADRPLDQQIYRRKNVWLTVLQVDKVQSSLRAASQKHEDGSPKSLLAKMYQYGAELLNMDSFLLRKSSTVSSNSPRKHSKNERFLKNKFSRAVVGDRHHHLSNQKLAASGQPGTEWTLQSTAMTLTSAADFKVTWTMSFSSSAAPPICFQNQSSKTEVSQQSSCRLSGIAKLSNQARTSLSRMLV